MPKLIVCAALAKPMMRDNEGVERFVESLDYYGYKYMILDAGKHVNTYQTKIGALTKAMPNLSKYDHVLFSDVRDVVAAAPQDEVLEKYTKIGAEVLVSAELNCYPEPKYAGYFDKLHPDRRWRYPNTGGILSTYEGLKKCMDEHTRHWEECGGKREVHSLGWKRFGEDQLAWTVAYCEERIKYQLDLDCEIFFTMYRTIPEDYGAVYDGRVAISETGSHPIFFHGNGTATRMGWALADRLKKSRQIKPN